VASRKVSKYTNLPATWIFSAAGNDIYISLHHALLRNRFLNAVGDRLSTVTRDPRNTSNSLENESLLLQHNNFRFDLWFLTG